MKSNKTQLKYSACVLLFGLFFFCSCKKNERELPKTVSESLVKEVQTLPSVSARRLAFANILNPDERVYLLHKQIDYLLKTFDLNPNQKSLIEDLEKNIPGDLYQGLQQRDSFMQKYGNQWNEKALNVLGKNFIQQYFTKVVAPGSESTASLAAVSASENTCECSTKIEFCGDFRCSAASSTICKHTEDLGCGWFLLYACNGMCGNGTGGG